MYKLKLYITGHTPRSRKLVCDLKKKFDVNCGGNYSLEVINIFDNPQAAYEDSVIATPTLIKTLPPPVRRIVGSLRDNERMLVSLDIVRV